jgi:excisionase family DNA binding protein
MSMNDSARASNMVPRGSIRLSEAFERFCRQTIPQWDDLQQLCVQWDENGGNDGDERGEDPYRLLFVSTDRAETVFRSALGKSHLRTYIHNFRTGIDLELSGREWASTGENVGINSDYTDARTPGPDCKLDGIAHPIFLAKTEFEGWMASAGGGAPSSSGKDHDDDASLVPTTRAYSVEEVAERTGISRSKLYEEMEDERLRARKCGGRRLILESDLDRYLRKLPTV